MKKGLVLDVFVITITTLLGIFITLFFRVEPIISLLIFYGLPSAYLLLMKRFNYKKIFLTALIGSLLFTILNTIILESNGWIVPENMLVIKLNLFGILQMGYFVWIFLLITFVILFYEYFFDRDIKHKISPNFKWFELLLLLTTVMVIIIYFFTNLASKIPYVHLVSALIYFFPPIIYILLKKPGLIKKFVFVLIPFFFINLAWELVALKTGQWAYLGDYIGHVILFEISMPFEEFMAFVVFASSTVLAYYEIFADDLK